MNALAIDCAVSELTVAAKKDRQTVKLSMDIGMKQSEKILPAIDYVMKEAGLAPSDLTYTACTLGPGTFTGLRLGLSALKALTLADNTPLYAVPSLDLYAHPYKSSKEIVLSVLEAKEDEFFYAFFTDGKKLRPEEDAPIEDILKQIDKESSVLVCGPGAKTFVERTHELSSLHSVHCYAPENDACKSLFEIAEDMIANKKEPLADYDGPLYVRKSEAEIVLEKKNSQQ